MEPERADVVIVGARCAGSAAAIALARAGRRVVVLDKAAFPSDTLSSHAMPPAGGAELQALGVLDAVLARGAVRNRALTFDDAQQGIHIHERFTPVDGVDYALSVPRLVLDELLVDAARRAGAEVRERSRVVDVLWEDGRAVGVRYSSGDGAERTLRAALVIGADGRRSRIAAAVGAWEPYRGSDNGRGFAFRTLADPLAGSEPGRRIAIFSANGRMSLLAPSCPEGRAVVTVALPSAQVAAFRSAPAAAWDAHVAADPGLAARLDGATPTDKVRAIARVPCFYRRSSGPGWALVGDAGHFKDPVVGQGQRDALFHGRGLGAAVAGALDDGPAALDAALRGWERARDRETASTYHWGNRSFWSEPMRPLTREVLLTFAGTDGAPDLTDAFSRLRPAEAVMGPPHLARALARALTRPGADRRAILRDAARELPQEAGLRRHRRLDGFRSARPVATETPGWSPGPPPLRRPAVPQARPVP